MLQHVSVVSRMKTVAIGQRLAHNSVHEIMEPEVTSLGDTANVRIYASLLASDR